MEEPELLRVWGWGGVGPQVTSSREDPKAGGREGLEPSLSLRDPIPELLSMLLSS